MASLRIHPLHVGTMNRQITHFCDTLEPQTVDLPLISWYIEGSDKRILVDTGGGDPAPTHPKMKPYERKKDQTIENALKKVGLTCDDIEIVIATHLHWDHSAGNGLFKNAKIIVQEEELKMALQSAADNSLDLLPRRSGKGKLYGDIRESGDRQWGTGDIDAGSYLRAARSTGTG